MIMEDFIYFTHVLGLLVLALCALYLFIRLFIYLIGGKMEGRGVPKYENPPPPPEKRCNGPEITQYRNGNSIVKCALRKKDCHCSWTEALKFIK